MASSWRSRGQSSSRPTFGGYSSYSTQSAYNNKWGRSTSSGNQSARARKAGSSSTTTSYRGVSNAFQGKINSYKTLYNQAQGAARVGHPTPAQLNTFARWIEKGAIVHTVSNMQLSRWARSTRYTFNARSASVASCKNILTAKFGKGPIKAVAKAKNGGFLVATAATKQGRPFNLAR